MELLEEILERENLNKAYKHVKANKGAPGVDGVTIDEAYNYIAQNKEKLLQLIELALWASPFCSYKTPRLSWGVVKLTARYLSNDYSCLLF